MPTGISLLDAAKRDLQQGRALGQHCDQIILQANFYAARGQSDIASALYTASMAISTAIGLISTHIGKNCDTVNDAMRDSGVYPAT